jgi:hypothetical protein
MLCSPTSGFAELPARWRAWLLPSARMFNASADAPLMRQSFQRQHRSSAQQRGERGEPHDGCVAASHGRWTGRVIWRRRDRQTAWPQVDPTLLRSHCRCRDELLIASIRALVRPEWHGPMAGLECEVYAEKFRNRRPNSQQSQLPQPSNSYPLGSRNECNKRRRMRGTLGG